MSVRVIAAERARVRWHSRRHQSPVRAIRLHPRFRGFCVRIIPRGIWCRIIVALHPTYLESSRTGPRSPDGAKDSSGLSAK